MTKFPDSHRKTCVSLPIQHWFSWHYLGFLSSQGWANQCATPGITHPDVQKTHATKITQMASATSSS